MNWRAATACQPGSLVHRTSRSLAELSGDVSYARLTRSGDDSPTGYAPAALDHWAARARDWVAGKDIPALPHVAAWQRQAKPRAVFVFIISAAKQRNLAAVMALQECVDSGTEVGGTHCPPARTRCEQRRATGNARHTPS